MKWKIWNTIWEELSDYEFSPTHLLQNCTIYVSYIHIRKSVVKKKPQRDTCSNDNSLEIGWSNVGSICAMYSTFFFWVSGKLCRLFQDVLVPITMLDWAPPHAILIRTSVQYSTVHEQIHWPTMSIPNVMPRSELGVWAPGRGCIQLGMFSLEHQILRGVLVEMYKIMRDTDRIVGTLFHSVEMSKTGRREGKGDVGGKYSTQRMVGASQGL